MDTLSKFITPGILFLLTLVFGVWLSHYGKPYSSILFNVHKLMALGAVVAAIIQVSRALKGAEIQILIILLLIVTGLCIVALFATGALMSIGKMDYHVMLTIHKIAPIVAATALAVTFYLLNMGSKL